MVGIWKKIWQCVTEKDERFAQDQEGHDALSERDRSEIRATSHSKEREAESKVQEAKQVFQKKMKIHGK